MNSDHALGAEIKRHAYAQPRKYMPDHIVERVFAEFLDGAGSAPLLIEGFPINEAQHAAMLRQLERTGRCVDCVIVLEANAQLLFERRQLRMACLACEEENRAGLPIDLNSTCCPFCGGPLQKRIDDDLAFFSDRLDNYNEEVKVILSFFAQTLIHRIDVTHLHPTELFERAAAIMCMMRGISG